MKSDGGDGRLWSAIGSRVEVGVVQEDLLLEPGCLGGWFDAQFLDEQAAQLLIRAQRLRRTARSIQREHPSAPEPLTQRVLSQHCIDLGSRVRSGGPRCEHRLEPVLAADQSFLAEPRRFDFERRHIVTESFERSPPPKAERLIDPLDRGNRVEREQAAPASEALRERLRVQFVGFEHENIPIAAPQDPRRTERLAQVRYVRVHRPLSGIRNRIAPQLRHQTIRSHDHPRRGCQDCKESPLAPRTDVELHVTVPRLDRPEHPYLDHMPPYRSG